MPEYPGGSMAMFEYLSKSIKYPKEAEEAQKEGRVIVTFIVNKDGSINDARVVKSVDPALDTEALRVINGMPNWTPGRQNGKVVNVKYTIPISFRLQTKETPKAEGTLTSAEPSQLWSTSANDPEMKDIISRLPGAKIDENGNVTINGKSVKKVLIDSKKISSPDELRKVVDVKTIQLKSDDMTIISKEK